MLKYIYFIVSLLISVQGHAQTTFNMPTVIKTNSEYFIFNHEAEKIYYLENFSSNIEVKVFSKLKNRITLTLNENGNKVYATGSSRTIYEYAVGSNNQNWKEITLNIDPQYIIQSTVFLGGHRILAATDDGFLFSHDLGKTWSLHKLYRNIRYEDIELFVPTCVTGIPDGIVLTSGGPFCHSDVLGYISDTNEPIFNNTHTNIERRTRVYFDYDLQSTFELKNHRFQPTASSQGYDIVEVLTGEILRTGKLNTRYPSILGVSSNGLVFKNVQRNEITNKVEQVITFDVYGQQPIKVLNIPLEFPKRGYVFSETEWIISDRNSIVITVNQGKNWKTL